MQQIDLGNGNFGDLVKILASGGVMAIALRIVERMFARADKRDDVATGLRTDMMRRLEEQNNELEQIRLDRDSLYRRGVLLESENLRLRGRYHDFMNWWSSQPNMPPAPPWLYEPVPGPTEKRRPPLVKETSDDPRPEKGPRDKRRRDS